MVGRGVFLRLGQRNVGQTLSMQAQHFDIDDKVNQRAHAARQLAFVADKGKQHANGKHRLALRPCRGAGLHYQARAQPQHHQVLQAKDKSVGRRKRNAHLGGTHITVLHLDQQVLPAGAPLLFAAKQLKRHDSAQTFQKVRVLACGHHQPLGRCIPKWPIRRPAQQRVRRHRCQHHSGQRGRIQQHHAQRRHTHQAV